MYFVIIILVMSLISISLKVLNRITTNKKYKIKEQRRIKKLFIKISLTGIIIIAAKNERKLMAKNDFHGNQSLKETPKIIFEE